MQYHLMPLLRKTVAEVRHCFVDGWAVGPESGRAAVRSQGSTGAAQGKPGTALLARLLRRHSQHLAPTSVFYCAFCCYKSLKNIFLLFQFFLWGCHQHLVHTHFHCFLCITS